MIRTVTTFVFLFSLTCFLSGCGGGDIVIDAPNNVVTTNTTTISTTADEDENPCASFTNENGDVIQGTLRGDNCEYFADFVGANNPLMVDLTIPDIEGVHIFWDTLQVGEDVDSGAIADGPTLTIDAGATLAW